MSPAFAVETGMAWESARVLRYLLSRSLQNAKRTAHEESGRKTQSVSWFRGFHESRIC